MTLHPIECPTLPDAGAVRTQRRGIYPMSNHGSLQDLLRLMGMDAAVSSPLQESVPVSLWRVRRNAVLLHEGARSANLYVVRTGSLKCLRTLEDGYEQVLYFAQVGDLLGFECLHGASQPYSAVALEDSTVYGLSVHELREPQRRGPILDEALLQALNRRLERAAETAEMMAAVASEARLARFLLWVSERMAQAGQSPRRFSLHMVRRDIASLLGVAHETVSRSFTTLAEAGCIRVDIREVEIVDFESLKARARATRGVHRVPATAAATRPVQFPGASMPAAQSVPSWFSGLTRAVSGTVAAT